MSPCHSLDLSHLQDRLARFVAICDKPQGMSRRSISNFLFLRVPLVARFQLWIVSRTFSKGASALEREWNDLAKDMRSGRTGFRVVDKTVIAELHSSFEQWQSRYRELEAALDTLASDYPRQIAKIRTSLNRMNKVRNNIVNCAPSASRACVTPPAETSDLETFANALQGV